MTVNAWGTVLSEEGLPYICGHGGSQWLCEDCAEAILQGKPSIIKPCPYHGDPNILTEPVMTTMSCCYPDCKLNIYEQKKEKKNG